MKVSLSLAEREDDIVKEHKCDTCCNEEESPSLSDGSAYRIKCSTCMMYAGHSDI